MNSSSPSPLFFSPLFLSVLAVSLAHWSSWACLIVSLLPLVLYFSCSPSSFVFVLFVSLCSLPWLALVCFSPTLSPFPFIQCVEFSHALDVFTDNSHLSFCLFFLQATSLCSSRQVFPPWLQVKESWCISGWTAESEKEDEDEDELWSHCALTWQMLKGRLRRVSQSIHLFLEIIYVKFTKTLSTLRHNEVQWSIWLLISEMEKPLPG